MSRPSAAPALAPGDILDYPAFYIDPLGNPQNKYVLILGKDRGGDYIFRLLTSRRGPQATPCYHGPPFAHYFLGLLGGALTANSAVDLRKQDEVLDARQLDTMYNQGAVKKVHELDKPTLCSVLDCTARCPDVMAMHADRIRDQMAALNCA